MSLAFRWGATPFVGPIKASLSTQRGASTPSLPRSGGEGRGEEALRPTRRRHIFLGPLLSLALSSLVPREERGFALGVRLGFGFFRALGPSRRLAGR
jgi:hypothetical protein